MRICVDCTLYDVGAAAAATATTAADELIYGGKYQVLRYQTGLKISTNFSTQLIATGTR